MNPITAFFWISYCLLSLFI